MEEAGLPNPLRSEPEQHSCLALFWHAFLELDDSRQRNMDGPQRLTIVDVAGWCRARGLDDPDTIDEVWRIIRPVDRRRVELMAEKAEQERELRKQQAAAEAKRRGDGT